MDRHPTTAVQHPAHWTTFQLGVQQQRPNPRCLRCLGGNPNFINRCFVVLIVVGSFSRTSIKVGFLKKVYVYFFVMSNSNCAASSVGVIPGCRAFGSNEFPLETSIQSPKKLHYFLAQIQLPCFLVGFWSSHSPRKTVNHLVNYVFF